MAMSALVLKNVVCGPGWGSKTGASAAGARWSDAPLATVVRDVDAGEDDGRGGDFFDPARGMALPPKTQGHELGPEVGAERLAGLQGGAGLVVPEGAGGGVGVGERDSEYVVLG